MRVVVAVVEVSVGHGPSQDLAESRFTGWGKRRKRAKAQPESFEEVRRGLAAEAGDDLQLCSALCNSRDLAKKTREAPRLGSQWTRVPRCPNSWSHASDADAAWRSMML